MNIDFTTITPLNLLILAIAIAILIPIVTWAVKKIGITKLGPIEIEHSNQATNALVLRQLDELDQQLHEHIWSMTRRLIHRATAPVKGQCHLGKTALREAMLDPLQERTISNHFTTRLTPTTIDSYKIILLKNIQDYYEDMYDEVTLNKCSVGFGLEPWDEVKPFYQDLVDEWLSRVGSEVQHTCRKKIAVYENAITTTTNGYWKDIFVECKRKNEQYIKNIDSLSFGK